jgi:hypothetical protein
MANIYVARMGQERKVYKEGGHSEDRGVDGRMGSECILRRLAWGSVEWIQLAQDRDRWRAFVNTVKNLRVLMPQI